MCFVINLSLIHIYRITIEIPGVTDANEVLSQMGKPGELYFITQKGSDGNDRCV